MTPIFAGVSNSVEVPRYKKLIMSSQLNVDEPSKVKAIYELSDDQRELRSIRIKLGMTKISFASALNIKHCTLDSYEYGKTKSVPKELLACAKALEAQHSEVFSTTRDNFNSKSMSDILKEWSEKLNVPNENSAALSRLLNTTPTTIRRWKENKVRRDILKLTKLAARVELGPVGALKLNVINALKSLKDGSADSAGFVFIPELSYKDAIDKIQEIKEHCASIVSILSEFEAKISSCTKIPGATVFIQMQSTLFHKYIKDMTDILSADGINENFFNTPSN